VAIFLTPLVDDMFRICPAFYNGAKMNFYIIALFGEVYRMTTFADVNNNERTELISIINEIGTYTDEHNWQKLGALFADHVTLDYSSLTNQKAEILSPSEIIAKWSVFLPGFDITQHKMSDYKIKLDGDIAKVTAKVRAFHYIENIENVDNTWIVDGAYDYELKKINGKYKVTMLKLNLNRTIGNNNLPNIAGNRVQCDNVMKSIQKDSFAINDCRNWPKPKNPVPIELQNNKNIKLIQSYYDAYARNDLDGIRKVMADDVEWYIPGRNVLSGTKKGIDEVMAFFALLQKGGFKAEPMILAANDYYVIDAHRGWSNTGKDDIDLNWVLLYQIENGKIRKVMDFSGDSYMSDKFFQKTYSFEDSKKVRTAN
jgi:ketosteroid isomerase-like protein